MARPSVPSVILPFVEAYLSSFDCTVAYKIRIVPTSKLLQTVSLFGGDTSSSIWTYSPNIIMTGNFTEHFTKHYPAEWFYRNARCSSINMHRPGWGIASIAGLHRFNRADFFYSNDLFSDFIRHYISKRMHRMQRKLAGQISVKSSMFLTLFLAVKLLKVNCFC